jgi:2-isopropylmalate synthase
MEFAKTIQHITEDLGTEINPVRMWETFQAEYLPADPAIRLDGHELRTIGSTTSWAVIAVVDGEHRTIVGEGNGPIDAFVKAIRAGLGLDIDVTDYAEHATGQGSDATAVAYVETTDGEGNVRWGVGQDPNTITASLKAVVSALLRRR